MTRLIRTVVGVWQGSDGATADVVYDGDEFDAMERRQPLTGLKGPKKKIAMYLRLQDESIAWLPFVASVHLLSDRTGVVAIFEPGQYTKPDGTDHFPAPNNAAIFNADGTLRFQLMVPRDALADRIAAFHSGSMPPQFAHNMGVLIATHADAPPEWAYAVDPNNPELIPTRQWVRY